MKWSGFQVVVQLQVTGLLLSQRAGRRSRGREAGLGSGSGAGQEELQCPRIPRIQGRGQKMQGSQTLPPRNVSLATWTCSVAAPLDEGKT